MPALYHSLKPIVDGLAGNSGLKVGRLERAKLNSEGFRETLSEERQKGPKRAKMAERKDAKQKAGPRGQTEKNREEAESSAGTKKTLRRAGRA